MSSPCVWTKDQGSDMTRTRGTLASMQLRRVEPQRVVMLMKVISRSVGSPTSSARRWKDESGMTTSCCAAKKWMMKMNGAAWKEGRNGSDHDRFQRL